MERVLRTGWSPSPCHAMRTSDPLADLSKWGGMFFSHGGGIASPQSWIPHLKMAARNFGRALRSERCTFLTLD